MLRGLAYACCLALGLPGAMYGQYDKYNAWELGTMLGLGAYTGDAHYGLLSPAPQGRIALTAHYRQGLRLSWSAELGHHRLRGKTRPELSALPSEASFDSQMTELRLGAEYNWYRYGSQLSYLDTKRWTPYISGGLGLVWAREEAQMLSPTLHLGLGVKYQLSKTLQLRARASWHYSTSDRLDALGNNASLARPIGLAGHWLRHGDSWAELSIGLGWIIHKEVKNCD